MQNTTLNIAGLHTNPSDLSEVPPGALKTANNIDIDRPSIATPRKGFSRFGDEFSNPAARVGSVFFFDGKVLVRRSDNVLMYWDGNDWQNYTGTVAEPDINIPVRAVEAGKNLLMTSGAGIRALPSATGSVRTAGIPAPTLRAEIVIGTASSFLAANSAQAYRVTIVYTDEHGVTYESAPSPRAVVYNQSSASCTVKLTFRVPSLDVSSYLVRIYKSAALDITSSLNEPSDEMTLHAELSETTSPLTDYYQFFTGVLPSGTNYGLALYTNASQQGIGAANLVPPYACDMTVFNGHMFYADVKYPHRQILYLKSSTIMNIDETITIGGVVYTAKHHEDTTNGYFKRYTDIGQQTFGTSDVNTSTSVITINGHYLDNGQVVRFSSSGSLPIGLSGSTDYYVRDCTTNTFKVATTPAGSAVSISSTGSGTHTVYRGIPAGMPCTFHYSLDIRHFNWATAESLVYVVNHHPSSTVKATFLSTLDDLEGIILFEAKTADAASFTVTTPATSLWAPALPQTSRNDAAPHGVAWSKYLQYESVPLTNTHPGIGGSRHRIHRVLAAGDSLFMLKRDGVFRLTGETEDNFNVEDFDTSVQIVAPRAACVLDNMVFCLTSDGPAIVSDLGVDKTFGNPVLKELKDLRGRTSAKVAHFNTNTWAVANDKRYTLSVGYLDDSSNPQTKLYVFNTRTKTWVTWSKKLTCAETSPTDGLLYAGSADYAYLLCQDRTTHDDTDTGSTVGIDSEIEWVVKSLAGPAASSQFSEVKVIMIDDFPASASLITSTDTNSTPITQTITTHAVGSGRRPHRQSVPRNHQRATLLNVKVRHNAAGYYEIAGISVEGSAVSTRTQK